MASALLSPTPAITRYNRNASPLQSKRPFSSNLRRRSNPSAINAKNAEHPLQYRKLGDSDLNISEITLGTMTFGEQNTEKEAHEMLSYAFENGINILDTAEAYPVPMKKETQGRTDLYIGSWMKAKSRDKIQPVPPHPGLHYPAKRLRLYSDTGQPSLPASRPDIKPSHDYTPLLYSGLITRM